MQTAHLIPVREFCVHHHIEITFVETLADNGLIETTIVEQVIYVQPEQLMRLEKFVRLHQDLAIHTDDLDGSERFAGSRRKSTATTHAVAKPADFLRAVSRLANISKKLGFRIHTFLRSLLETA